MDRPSRTSISAKMSWNPYDSPPDGIRIDNLRRRGLDIIRFNLHLPNRLIPRLLQLPIVVAVMAVLWLIYSGWYQIGFLALTGLAHLGLIVAALNFDRYWTLSLTPGNLGVAALVGRTDSFDTRQLDLSDIKSIDVRGETRKAKRALTIVTQTDSIDVGVGLNEDALVWLKNYLIMEIAGLAWRPLHGIDRSQTVTQKRIVNNHALLKQDLALRLVDIFIEQAPDVVQSLGRAVEVRDAKVIRQNAHWLKSASANVGAQNLSRLCQTMQIYVMDDDFSRTGVLYDEINRSNTDVINWLNEVRHVSATIIAEQLPGVESLSVAATPKNDVLTGECGPDRISKLASHPGSAVIEAKILVVDDSAVSREIAKNFLGDIVSHAVFANDGKIALELCNQEKFDLILTDCEMSDMDGFELTGEVREMERRQNLLRTPIVALTANALRGDRTRCIKAGMDDYMSKPYTVEELHDKLTGWLIRAGNEAVPSAT